MYTKFTQEVAENKLNEVGVKYLPFDYKTIKDEIEFYCSKCGKLHKRDISSLIRGRTKCLDCSGNRKYTQNEIERKINDLKIIFKPFTYINLHQNIDYQCPICKEYKNSQIVHLFNGHTSCKGCVGKEKKKQVEVESTLKELGIVFKPFEYINNETLITHQCKECNKEKTNIYREIIGGHTLCKECGIKKISDNQLLPQQEVENRLKNMNIDFLPFIHTGRDTVVEIKCKKCTNIFKTKYHYLFNNGSILCKRCQKSTSTQENELKDYIKSLGVNIIENKRFSNTEIDIYIPQLKLGFEYNGTYWHSDKQKDKNYHYDKVTNAQNEDIRLIHIWEHEWLHNQDQIKSYIKAQLGLCEKRIFARKCDVREIDYKTAKPLLEYHQQKSTNAQIYLGLYYENELVLCMLFGKNTNNGNKSLAEWDVKREICKEGYSIVGGKSKVFNYFVNKYNPESVSSFVDRSKFTGKSYEIMGFKLHHIVPARYDWVYRNTLKFKKRSPNIYKEMKQLYEDGKVYRIYDSGRYCYIFNKFYEE